MVHQTPFKNKNKNNITISEWIEDQFDYYFYLLSSRKVWHSSDQDFYNMPIFRIYKLYMNELQRIDNEKREHDEIARKNGQNVKREESEDHPETLAEYNELTGRDPD